MTVTVPPPVLEREHTRPTRPEPAVRVVREYFVQGMTTAGRVFRPSDWAERLCGVLSPYRPGGTGSGPEAHLGYSPYARPVVIGGIKCVVVDERLRELEHMAFDFVMSFAKDNDLPVTEACSLPDGTAASAARRGA